MIARKLPLPVWLKIFTGGILGHIGWIIFFTGTLLSFALQVPATVAESVAFRRPSTMTAGVIGEVTEANAEVNGQAIFRAEFSFRAGDRTYPGYSHLRYRPEPDSPVTVEYLVSNPAVARIEGGSRSLFGSSGLWVLLFPALGLLLLLTRTRAMLRQIRLLHRGLLAHGRLVKKEGTNTSVNEQTVWELTFTFQDRHGTERRTVVRTHEAGALTDDKREPILYLDRKPDVSHALDALPGNARVLPDGQIAFYPKASFLDYLPPAYVLLITIIAVLFS